MGSVQALRNDYNKRQLVKSKKRDAAVQAIMIGSVVLGIVTTAYLVIRSFAVYGFWVPTLTLVAIVMLITYVSANQD